MPATASNKFFLFAGKTQTGAVKSFAGNFLPFTQAKDHHVGFSCQRHGVGNIVTVGK